MSVLSSKATVISYSPAKGTLHKERWKEYQVRSEAMMLGKKKSDRIAVFISEDAKEAAKVMKRFREELDYKAVQMVRKPRA